MEEGTIAQNSLKERRDSLPSTSLLLHDNQSVPRNRGCGEMNMQDADGDPSDEEFIPPPLPQ